MENKFSSSVQLLTLLLLIIPIVSLAVPPLVEAAPPAIEEVSIEVSPASVAGNSHYAHARQTLIGEWTALADKTTFLANHTRGYIVAPGYSPASSTGTGLPVKFSKAGDTITIKVVFDQPIVIKRTPTLLVQADGVKTRFRAASLTPIASDPSDPNTRDTLVLTHTVAAGANLFGDSFYSLRWDQGTLSGGANITNLSGEKIDPIGHLDSTADWKQLQKELEKFFASAAAGTLNKGRIGKTFAEIEALPIGGYQGLIHLINNIPATSTTGLYEHNGLNYLIDAIPANVLISTMDATGYTTEGYRNNLDAAFFALLEIPHSTSTVADIGTLDLRSVTTTEPKQTGTFDLEVRFFNYGTGRGNFDLIADTTQGFAADDIELTDPNNGNPVSGWKVSMPEYIGLDHRGRHDVGDVGDETFETNFVKHSASYKVYKVTLTPPQVFNGSVAIKVPAGATTDIPGNKNLQSNTLIVPVNTGSRGR